MLFLKYIYEIQKQCMTLYVWCYPVYAFIVLSGLYICSVGAVFVQRNITTHESFLDQLFEKLFQNLCLVMTGLWTAVLLHKGLALGAPSTVCLLQPDMC